MLGGTYAEYVCLTAGIDKTTPASKADPGPVFDAIRLLFDEVEHAGQPVISAASCEPVAIAAGSKSTPDDKNRFSGFSEALEMFYPTTRAEKVRITSKPKLSEEERIHKYQETAIKKFDDKIKKTEEMVAAIYENYPFIAQVISSLDAASKRLSWQEIERHIRDTSSADAKRIVAFHPEEAAVDLDIGKKVKIFVHESVEQNAGRYYAVIKKFKKKKEGALAAMKTSGKRKR